MSHDSTHPATLNAAPRRHWRSLQELAGDDEFAASLAREFPEHADRLVDEPSRRQFLKLMSASLALAGVAGCVEQPQEQIVPYVQAPEYIVPGIPLYYATVTTLDGAGVGLLVASHMGRPIKVEGNPFHPAVPEVMAGANAAAGADQLRFGATDAFSQALVLSLYDPDRSQTVLRGGQIDTWETFLAELRTRLAALQPNGGRGLHVLSETVISPTLSAQREQFRALYPSADWHEYEPINRDNALAGNRLAFGADVQPIYDLSQADAILSLDDNFLAEGPMHLVAARQFAQRRTAPTLGTAQDQDAVMNRLYVVESGFTPTGAAADHRLPLGPVAVGQFAAQLAVALDAALGDDDAELGTPPHPWVKAIADDLAAHRGRSLVLAGRGQPPAVHSIVHQLNALLGNVGQTVTYRQPPALESEPQVESLRRLVDAMHRGTVEALVILGGNPVYDAPADLAFAAALARVPFAVHLSPYVDETSAACLWHIPAAHGLESWSDTRAADGTASIGQPLIAPLYKGKTAHDVLHALIAAPPATSHDIVASYWRQWHTTAGQGGDFDTFWRTALHNGVVPGTQSAVATVSASADAARTAVAELLAKESPPAPESAADPITIAFAPDVATWDGRFANNGWLQELPRPFTTLTWSNAALVGPQTAADWQLESGDMVELAIDDRRVEVPALVVPGQPPATIGLQLGYGRRKSGRVGDHVGADVYPLRTSGAMWSVPGAALRKTGRRQQLAVTQHHFTMAGRHLVRAGTLDEFRANPRRPEFMNVGHNTAPEVSMYPAVPYDGYKWGLVVNQSACIGCNACVIACQAENNIPIVGADQVSRGREMHWLRIDSYFEGSPDEPRALHQPVMCMHCEKAPCEVVCPVAATTHSGEGLNEMTYNRCVGTRYCANNCPYKVRRFNFYDYNAELRDDPTMQLRPNPNVTVRSRGVMEKCTYCVQRINSARITAEKQDRPIRDGEIVTACQAACPTEALTFGNLNDSASAVATLAESPLNYSLLGELNTRPRTTYLAAVRNPNPALAQATDDEHGH